MRIIVFDYCLICIFGLHIIFVLFMSRLFVRAEEDMLFKETEAGEFHMADFDVVWRDMDLLTCVIRCVREFRSCYSVTHDETTNMCTPGSWLVLNPSIPLPQAPGKIYSTGARCNEASKFKYYKQDDVAACYWASDSMLNYKDSKENCSANGAHLYTIKLMEKWTILKKITSGPNGNYWIGLDDIREEDVFRWVDDDSRMSESLRQELFNKYQPDNWNNTEDCAYLKGAGKLNDENCLHPFKFVCEMSLFQ
ncbi:unnamed protein product [Lymnaea stagnalis]|uniref:C-type lectin domain-containing protein n=1 Tax=Lymnaea stagnalis TaxID=6523 RepID=A0AAV2GX21_LYMST